MLSRYLLGFALSAAVCAQTCYYPDKKTVAKGYSPCFSGDQPSHCCSGRSVCLTNGFCMDMSPPYTMARGACTDQNWEGGSCEDPCWPVVGSRTGGCSIVLYNNRDGVSTYCPNSIVANSSHSIGCAGEAEPFTIKQGDIITDRGVLSRASCAIDTIDPTAAATPLPSPTPTGAGQCKESSSTHVAIGAGVGVPLGVIAILGLCWGLYERRKRYQLLGSAQGDMMQGQHYNMAPTSTSSHTMGGVTPISSPGHTRSVNVAPQELGNEGYYK
ncbi:hypothetical protein P168DRAFT_280776 [Aspergillus campestris IBT 28561]|uniref:Mid2 domain-containing protein n=1 Tax=Aspergillus campestris (strain IBT 28561) TaxID=1392248 RepID=A0A2I1D7Q0_ASPC2|nr:uncharacterized protein P168DRAFT_280776 [Aspergillus campestris IBT 28561]PKY05909.1 hypothetical protein P168DRAFT_280776 [Aspergillus campestris IBT 28561]